MNKLRKLAWVFPFIGGIITFLALLWPVAYHSDPHFQYEIWMWGLVSFSIWDEDSGYDEGTLMNTNFDVLFPSLIFSISIIISMIVLFISISMYQDRVEKNTENPNLWLISSLFNIAFTILWIIEIEMVWPPELPRFWGFMRWNFGLYGLFIGSIISILGYVFTKISNNK